jgi:hypothetical protein
LRMIVASRTNASSLSSSLILGFEPSFCYYWT